MTVEAGGPARNAKSPSADGLIQLRIQSVGQLFHTLDPLPFRERDLDAAVEEYVVGWAGEMPRGRPISIEIRLPAIEAHSESASHIGDAFRNYFTYRAEMLGWDLRRLFERGRVSLAVGLSVLASCILAGGLTSRSLGAGYFTRFFEEGLIILGWVANWRPIEIFLYDWWPIVARRALYCRLATATIEVVEDASATAPGPRE